MTSRENICGEKKHSCRGSETKPRLEQCYYHFYNLKDISVVLNWVILYISCELEPGDDWHCSSLIRMFPTPTCEVYVVELCIYIHVPSQGETSFFQFLYAYVGRNHAHTGAVGVWCLAQGPSVVNVEVGKVLLLHEQPHFVLPIRGTEPAASRYEASSLTFGLQLPYCCNSIELCWCL